MVRPASLGEQNGGAGEEDMVGTAPGHPGILPGHPRDIAGTSRGY